MTSGDGRGEDGAATLPRFLFLVFLVQKSSKRSVFSMRHQTAGSLLTRT